MLSIQNHPWKPFKISCRRENLAFLPAGLSVLYLCVHVCVCVCISVSVCMCVRNTQSFSETESNESDCIFTQLVLFALNSLCYWFVQH